MSNRRLLQELSDDQRVRIVAEFHHIYWSELFPWTHSEVQTITRLLGLDEQSFTNNIKNLLRAIDTRLGLHLRLEAKIPPRHQRQKMVKHILKRFASGDDEPLSMSEVLALDADFAETRQMPSASLGDSQLAKGELIPWARRTYEHLNSLPRGGRQSRTLAKERLARLVMEIYHTSVGENPTRNVSEGEEIGTFSQLLTLIGERILPGESFDVLVKKLIAEATDSDRQP